MRCGVIGDCINSTPSGRNASLTALTIAADGFAAGVFAHGEHFLYVEPGRPGALARQVLGLWDDPSRTAAIGQAARRAVLRHFAWGDVCRRTVRLYEEARGLGGDADHQLYSQPAG